MSPILSRLIGPQPPRDDATRERLRRMSAAAMARGVSRESADDLAAHIEQAAMGGGATYRVAEERIARLNLVPPDRVADLAIDVWMARERGK